jgi:hypothetical protein
LRDSQNPVLSRQLHVFPVDVGFLTDQKDCITNITLRQWRADTISSHEEGHLFSGQLLVIDWSLQMQWDSDALVVSGSGDSGSQEFVVRVSPRQS